ncbi:hypothetical protein [Geobacter sp. AOG2]|uniref:hypothetical protein n=1 Tax=Geobacter sp. AOG2 TaxID=1566347 RepID=UPI001CC61783|nr:hypothetical protein [Geobacter sp. AOG2]GFE62897.1 hypothetical protein AOG2_34860 [Geobacter sp. AOG2]
MKRAGRALVVVVSFLAMGGIARAGDALSHDATVALIARTMAANTSVARQERYASIKIDACVMDYRVLGTFPVGTPYDIRFSGIDFASLNPRLSETGHDYTAFVILNFTAPAIYRINGTDTPIHSVVINTFDDASATVLFKAFVHLGELCGAKKLP